MPGIEPARSAARRPTILSPASAPAPTRRHPLFGRERAARRLASMLADGRSGVITVTGPGGVGKSALIAALRPELDHAFADRILVAERTESGAESARRFLSAVPASGEPVDGTRIPMPRAACWPRRRLLIIDPADDLAATIGELSASLPPGSQILACAIRPLGLPRERTVALGPLPVIDPEEDPEALAANPGVQLFRSAAANGGAAGSAGESGVTDAAHAARPAHATRAAEATRATRATGAARADHADLEAVASVCRHVGGWPLAIEHAAALTHLLDPRALSDMLADRPELVFELAATPADPTRLLPSLRAAFDRTWRQLTTPERSTLRAAAMFAGPFGVPQVAAVAANPIATTMRALTSLLELNLVERSAPRPDRFTITSPVRQYTCWTFGRRAPEGSVRLRYAQVVRETARASALAGDGGDEVAAMRAIGDVQAELVPVLTQLLDSGALGDAVQLAADLAPGLVQSGDFDDVGDRLDGLLRHPDAAQAASYAGALVGYADIVFTGIHGADRRELATARLQHGIRLLREGSDPHTLLRALSVMIRAWPVMRDPRVVADCVREGVAISREIGAPAWLARFEAWSGMLAHQTGDLASALTLGGAALARGRRCGDLRARLLAGLLLHTVPEPPQDVPGGLPDVEGLLQLADELHEPRLGSILLAYLARQNVLAGRLPEASYWSARALEVGGELDTPFGAGFAIMFLAGVARARGDIVQAVALHGMVADRFAELAAELPPRVAAEYSAMVVHLRGSLEPATFDTWARSGSVLSWRDATVAALAYAHRSSDGGAAGSAGAGAAAPEPDRRLAHPSVPAPSPPGPAAGAMDALPGPAPHELTPREQKVLDLIAEGLDTRTIAERLRVSVHAVSHHTSNILGKLGVENRTQAAIWAVHRRYDRRP